MHDAALGFRINYETSHALITQVCVAYLLQFNKPGPLDKNLLSKRPLAEYAAEHWVFHATSCGIDKIESGLT